LLQEIPHVEVKRFQPFSVEELNYHLEMESGIHFFEEKLLRFVECDLLEEYSL
jgi:hypothetical protein